MEREILDTPSYDAPFLVRTKRIKRAEMAVWASSFVGFVLTIVFIIHSKVGEGIIAMPLLLLLSPSTYVLWLRRKFIVRDVENPPLITMIPNLIKLVYWLALMIEGILLLLGIWMLFILFEEAKFHLYGELLTIGLAILFIFLGGTSLWYLKTTKGRIEDFLDQEKTNKLLTK